MGASCLFVRVHAWEGGCGSLLSLALIHSPRIHPPIPLSLSRAPKGKVPHAIEVHPDREHILYPLGCNVVIEKIGGKKAQTFLQGHNDFVSCVAVSKSGKFVATGQQTHMGFEAEIIIWDFEARKELRRFKLHRVKVQDLRFSPSDKYLVSLGGEDDGKASPCPPLLLCMYPRFMRGWFGP